LTIGRLPYSEEEIPVDPVPIVLHHADFLGTGGSNDTGATDCDGSKKKGEQARCSHRGGFTRKY
jgi:hypothetical protein